MAACAPMEKVPTGHRPVPTARSALVLVTPEEETVSEQLPAVAATVSRTKVTEPDEMDAILQVSDDVRQELVTTAPMEKAEVQGTVTVILSAAMVAATVE